LFGEAVWKALCGSAVHAGTRLEFVLLEFLVEELHSGTRQEKAVVEQTVKNFSFFFNNITIRVRTGRKGAAAKQFISGREMG
jgi:hypothetical protein